MSATQLDRIESVSGEPKRADESIAAYIDRLASRYEIDRALADQTIEALNQDDPSTTDAVGTFCDRIEEPNPTLADRVEASEDFGAALEQSTAILVQYRRIVLLVSLLVAIVAMLSLAGRFGLI